jgi:hypothetical protein
VPEKFHAEPIEEDKENGDGDGDWYEHAVVAILLDPVQCLLITNKPKKKSERSAWSVIENLKKTNR